MTEGRSLIDRYLAGDRDRVWHELRHAGDRVRHPDLIEDAKAVCDAMARRARQNVDVIIERLTEQGYRFHTNDDAETPVTPHRPPGPRAEAVTAWLDDHIGAVPLTVTAWLSHVGDVWLVGTHPEWPESSAADPLVIELEGSQYPDHDITEYFTDELEMHRSVVDHEGGVFQLPVSPDRLHKSNTSGGTPYAILLPDACADATIAMSVHLHFVSYLQWVFEHGGFPRVTDGRDEWRIRQSLARDLLPL